MFSYTENATWLRQNYDIKLTSYILTYLTQNPKCRKFKSSFSAMQRIAMSLLYISYGCMIFQRLRLAERILRWNFLKWFYLCFSWFLHYFHWIYVVEHFQALLLEHGFPVLSILIGWWLTGSPTWISHGGLMVWLTKYFLWKI